jgi:tRNA threonylcarbamoyladenosine biosynthesis protein TsaB
MEQYILAIDTSSKALTVALLRGAECLAEDGMTAERNHSIYLLPVIQRMLASCDVTVEQLQAIAVGRGPGSYTGVRIGVTVAKTMAWSLQIPLIGVSSLSALAHGTRGNVTGTSLFVPMFDARRGQVYSGLYADRDGWWETVIEDRIVDAEQWLALVAERAELMQTQLAEEHGGGLSEVVLSGDTAPFGALISEWQERLTKIVAGIQLQVETSHLLSAYHVGLLARSRFLKGESDDLHAFTPNYTQLAEAEAKLATTRPRATGELSEA